MLRLFARDGHQVHIVVPSAGPIVDQLQNDGITVHTLKPLALVERMPLRGIKGKLAFCFFRYPYSVLWLTKLILQLKADIVHTNSGVLPAPALAAKLTGRKHLWHIREFFYEFPGLWRFYQRYIWKLSTRIVVIADAVRDQFDPALRGKCVTVYNGLGHDALLVDDERARKFRADIGNAELLVGVVGRIKLVRKGQEVLVKAAALLTEKYPEARYVIVGSVAPGNEEHLIRLKELVREKGLEDKVVFTGDIQKPRDIFAAFDVTVVPSVLPEPFGRVVMESMAAGTPVIGSDCGGIPEQIVPGVTGLLFKPGDEKDLAKALDELLGDRAKRLRMAEEGKRHVREKFEDSVVYVKFKEVFTFDSVLPETR
jgi:glycosyltransferase involved in cell wall biosynthesis